MEEYENLLELTKEFKNLDSSVAVKEVEVNGKPLNPDGIASKFQTLKEQIIPIWNTPFQTIKRILLNSFFEASIIPVLKSDRRER